MLFLFCLLHLFAALSAFAVAFLIAQPHQTNRDRQNSAVPVATLAAFAVALLAEGVDRNC